MPAWCKVWIFMVVMTQAREDVVADSPVGDAPWGHASGWAQLYGQRRTVSCVVLGLEHGTALAEMFDSLSDALTEAGYPWEVLMVDVAANPRLSSLLMAWSERSGFRRVVLSGGTTPALALTQALGRARGDAVLLMEAHGGELAVPIPEMVSRWSDGLEVVRSRWIGLEHLRSTAGAAARDATGGAVEQLLGEEALLLDRRVIDGLLGDKRPPATQR
jgi:hypothetical protein